METQFRFLPGLLLAGLFTLTLFSCKKEAAQQGSTTIGESQENASVTQRAVCSPACDFYITSTSDANVTLCGDLTFGSGTCNICSVNDASLSLSLTANVQSVVCVNTGGSVCISISSTSAPIQVTVQFGSSSSQTVTIPTGGTACFNTDGNCSITALGC